MGNRDELGAAGRMEHLEADSDELSLIHTPLTVSVVLETMCVSFRMAVADVQGGDRLPSSTPVVHVSSTALFIITMQRRIFSIPEGMLTPVVHSCMGLRVAKWFRKETDHAWKASDAADTGRHWKATNITD